MGKNNTSTQRMDFAPFWNGKSRGRLTSLDSESKPYPNNIFVKIRHTPFHDTLRAQRKEKMNGLTQPTLDETILF